MKQAAADPGAALVRAGMRVGPRHWVDGRPPAARTRRSEAERRRCRYLAETERAARERGLDVRPWRHSSALVSRSAALTRLLLRPWGGGPGEAVARTRAGAAIAEVDGGSATPRLQAVVEELPRELVQSLRLGPYEIDST